MKRTLLIVAAIPLLVGGAEGALRLYGFGRGIRFRPQPLLGWEMVPGQRAFNVRGRVPVRINRYGLRGPDVGAKSPNALRILFIGDGTTLNNQTAEEATFPFLVQADLQRRHSDRRVEALVGGVSGYQLEQDLGLLKLRESQLEPDIVVIGFCWNDWERNTMQAPDVGPRAYGEYTGEVNWFERTAIGDFWNRLGRILARRRQARAVAHGEQLPDSSHEDVFREHVTTTLDSIAATCDRGGREMVVLLVPARLTRHDPDVFARRTQELRAWAASRNVVLVDPSARFEDAAARGIHPFLDEFHLSAAAQPLVAAAVVGALDSLSAAHRGSRGEAR
jgi:lysophospholipase L1-like esterase